MRRILRLAIYLVIVWWLLAQIPAARTMVEAPIVLAQGVVATVELHNLRKIILSERALNGALPPESAFASLIDRNLQSRLKDSHKDSWGRPYVYRRAPRAFELRSAGPDRRYNTDDDLVLNWKE